MREIVLDTETTGLDPNDGHKIIEIGCIELVNRLPTGSFFHTYLDPQRNVPAEAVAIHGLSQEFLLGKPVFADQVGEFLDFIGESSLVIHNAAFDLKFLNAELAVCERPALNMERVVDTLRVARKKFPGAPVSLDALCKRFGIDNSRRDKHGALLDSELLAGVYLELCGGRQTFLDLSSNLQSHSQKDMSHNPEKHVTQRVPRPHAPSEGEVARHRTFLNEKVSGHLWDDAV